MGGDRDAVGGSRAAHRRPAGSRRRDRARRGRTAVGPLALDHSHTAARGAAPSPTSPTLRRQRPGQGDARSASRGASINLNVRFMVSGARASMCRRARRSCRRGVELGQQPRRRNSSAESLIETWQSMASLASRSKAARWASATARGLSSGFGRVADRRRQPVRGQSSGHGERLVQIRSGAVCGHPAAPERIEDGGGQLGSAISQLPSPPAARRAIGLGASPCPPVAQGGLHARRPPLLGAEEGTDAVVVELVGNLLGLEPGFVERPMRSRIAPRSWIGRRGAASPPWRTPSAARRVRLAIHCPAHPLSVISAVATRWPSARRRVEPEVEGDQRGVGLAEPLDELRRSPPSG